MVAYGFFHLEISLMPLGMSRQQTWMKVLRDYWHNDRLLSVRWLGGGNMEVGKELWGQHRRELRWYRWWEMRREEVKGGIMSGG
jgi:hypothetical protein